MIALYTVSRRRAISKFLAIFLAISHSPSSADICPINCTCVNSGQEVDCSGKHMTSLPEGIPFSVVKLDISHNSLVSLDCGHLRSFPNLTHFDVAYNSLELLQSGALNGPERLIYFNISHNRLTYVPTNLFEKQLCSLIDVDMSYNKIRVHQGIKEFLSTCFAVEHYDISNNRLDHGIFTSFEYSTWLKNLDLSGNPLGHVPYTAFRTMVSLKVLVMNNCNISWIDFSGFVGLKSLQYLHLADNNLRYLAREMFQPLQELVELDLSENHLTCTCGASRFQNWLFESHVDLRPTTTCSGITQDGAMGEFDLKYGNIAFLCEPEERFSFLTPRLCQNAPMHVEIVAISKKSAKFIIRSANPYDSVQNVSVSNRLFGSPDANVSILRISNNITHTLNDLRPLSNYIFCARHLTCESDTCVEFTTKTDDVNDVNYPSPEILVIVIGVVGAVAIVTVITLVVVIACCKTAWLKSDKDTFGDEEETKQCGKRFDRNNAHPYQGSNELYEAIPANLASHQDTESAFCNLAFVHNDEDIVIERPGFGGEDISSDYLTPPALCMNHTPGKPSRPTYCNESVRSVIGDIKSKTGPIKFTRDLTVLDVNQSQNTGTTNATASSSTNSTNIDQRVDTPDTIPRNGAISNREAYNTDSGYVPMSASTYSTDLDLAVVLRVGTNNTVESEGRWSIYSHAYEPVDSPMKP